jgi:hypothetical protein
MGRISPGVLGFLTDEAVMTTQEVLDFLEAMERRLAALEGEAQQTLEGAQHTLDRLTGLRDDLRQIDRAVHALAPPDEKEKDSDDDTPRP